MRARRPKTLPPTRANAGIEAAYRAALDRLIREMQASITYWLRARYRQNEPEIAKLAQDQTPAAELQSAVQHMARRWQKRFNDFSLQQATRFAKAAGSYSDAAFRGALRKSGMSIQLKESPAILDAYQAIVNENVALIKSIPSQHFTEIEGLVMRSVQHGRDLEFLSKELEARYGVTRRRAALIARDQSNKATAVMTRVRQQEIGITEAIWLHSHGGKHPRPEHVKADGKRYEVAKGMLIEGEWIWPGEKINCRCVAKAIVPGLS